MVGFKFFVLNLVLTGNNVGDSHLKNNADTKILEKYQK